ncbi:MAG: hypothetical protein AAF235_05395, partial [Planctomycetota bacterium]
MSSCRHASISATLATVLAAGCPSLAVGQTTWTGAGDGVSFSDAGNWFAGVPGAADDAFIDGGNAAAAAVSLTAGGSVRDLTIDAGDALTIAIASTLTVNGTLTNNGVVSLDLVLPGNTFDATLAFNTAASDAMLTGTGEIVMSDDFDHSVLALSNAFSIINGADHTIRGAGQILANVGGFVNDGLVQATGSSAALVVDPGSGAQFVNNGTLEALGSVGMTLNAGVYVNTNGLIAARDGSLVQLQNGAVVQGGEVTTTGTGRILANSGSDLSAVTVTDGSRLDIAPQAAVDVFGGITNNGTINLTTMTDGNSFDSTLNFADSASISGNGTIDMVDDIDNRITASTNSVTVTQGAGHSIRGSGFILSNIGGFVNEGLIQATGASVALTLDPGSLGFVNNSIMQALGTAGMIFNAGTYDNTNGLITVGDDSLVRFLSGANIQGGTLTAAGSGLFDAASGADLTGVTLTAGSRLDVASQAGVD